MMDIEQIEYNLDAQNSISPKTCHCSTYLFMCVDVPPCRFSYEGKLVWLHSNYLTILLMPFFSIDMLLANKNFPSPIIRSNSCEPWSREFAQWMQIEIEYSNVYNVQNCLSIDVSNVVKSTYQYLGILTRHR